MDEARKRRLFRAFNIPPAAPDRWGRLIAAILEEEEAELRHPPRPRRGRPPSKSKIASRALLARLEKFEPRDSYGQKLPKKLAGEMFLRQERALLQKLGLNIRTFAALRHKLREGKQERKRIAAKRKSNWVVVARVTHLGVQHRLSTNYWLREAGIRYVQQLEKKPGE